MAHKNSLKKKGLLARNAYPLTSAVVAAVIMLFAYIAWTFFPFGENIILRMDLYHQYAPLFAELYERIFGGHSLLYSFTSGLGSSFLGNYFNYLSSPTLLFVLIFGHKNIPEAIAAIVLVKAAASAYTFTYFLGKITKKSNAAAVAFGLLYAFCGYFIAYYWNVMWLDAVVIFPIVILGIWYIIEEGRSLPYVLSLAYVMMTNYYMAFMVCVLSVIFFLYFYFSKNSFSTRLHYNLILKPKYKNSLRANALNSAFLVRGATFAAASVLAALIAAFALLPVFFILQNSSATNSAAPSSFTTYFTVFDFLANHLAGVEPTIRSSGDAVYPNVYCGIITLMLVPLYMFSKKFSVKEKIASTAVIALFFFSFNINYLNYFWHGLHFPNDLPYRFSFAYSFFLLYLAYKTFTVMDKVSSKAVLGSAAGVAAFAAIVEKVGSANVDLRVVWTSIAFAVLYAVVLVFMKNPKYVKSSMAILLITAVCAELLIADTPNYKVTQTKTSYTSSYDDTKYVVDEIKEAEGENGFYRMELATLLTRMDNCWFFYPGVSTFTSMAYQDVAALQTKLGLFGNNINSYTYNCQTGLYNSMMSLKYIVDNHDYVSTDNYKPRLDGNFLYTKVNSYNNMTVYKNNYWLPVAFSADDDLDTAWAYDSSLISNNPFALQNDFFYQASGVADILTPIAGSVSDSSNLEVLDDSAILTGEFNLYKQETNQSANEITYIYHIEKTQNVYVYIKSSNVSSVLVTAGSFAYNQSFENKSYVLDVGTVEAGTDLYLNYSLDDEAVSASVNQYVYGMDQEKFISAYNAIVANGTLDVTENTESYIKGTVNLAEGKMLFTSIPYDTAWSVYVDGEKLSADQIVKIGNAFLGIHMDAGEHTVELKYIPNGLIAGCTLTVFGILLLILLEILKKKKKLMFSESYREEVLRLGRWRDRGLEAQAVQQKESDGEPAAAGSVPEESFQNEQPPAEDAWSAALREAERFVKTKAQVEPEFSEDLGISPEKMPESKTEQVQTPSGAEETDGMQEPEDGHAQENMDEDALLDEMSIEDVLDQFERQSEESETPKKPRMTADDKKSAQKKRLNLTIFVIIMTIVVIAAVGIMIYAAKNSGKSPAGDSSEPIHFVFEEDSESESESVSEERTTIATTVLPPQETTQKTTSPATKAPVTQAPATQAPVTKAPVTKAPVTKAPVTQAPATEGYTGAYETYTVKAGDNFYSILRSFGIADTPANVQTMCDFNGISVNSGLSVGQTLKIPTQL